MEKRRGSKRRWFVILGGHITMLVCVGTFRSFGVLLVEWMKYFDTSSAGVSAIMSMLAASQLLAGFATGPLIKSLGCHNVIVLGAAFSIAGIIAGVFVSSPIALCGTVGLFGGFGLGLAFISAQVSVALHFKKGYSRANSVVSSGVGIGIMVLPPIFQVCIHHYGWRGTLLLLSGLQGQVIIAGLMSRPPKRRRPSPPSSSSSSKKRPLQAVEDPTALYPLNSNRMDAVGSTQPPQGGSQRTVQVKGVDTAVHPEVHEQGGLLNDQSVNGSRQIVFTDVNSKGDPQNKSTDCAHDDTRNEEKSVQPPSKTSLLLNAGYSDDMTMVTRDDLHAESSTDTSQSTSHFAVMVKKIDCDDAEEISSIHIYSENCALNSISHDIRISENDNASRELSNENVQFTKDDLNSDSSCAATSSRTMSRPSCCYRIFKASGWTLFKDSIGFSLCTVCVLTTDVCYGTISAHFVASAVYAGINIQSASFLLSILGIASFIARLGNGWFIDKKIIAPQHLFIVSMVVLGASIIISRASDVYGWYAFMAVLFGASTGVFKCLTPVVMRKYVGVENLAKAMGIVLIFVGTGNLLAPVFAGALYDATNTYDLPFFVAGSILLVSASLLLLEPPLRRRREKYRDMGTKDAENGDIERAI